MALSDPQAPPPPPSGGLGPVPERLLAAGEHLWRIHGTAYGPVFFGKNKRYRFDDPNSKYGVLYAGLDVYCAFLETYRRVPDSQGIVLRSSLKNGSISSLLITRPLRLVDLTGHHLAQLRIDSKIFSYTDYSSTQQWSRAFFDHSSSFDGLLFHSRHDPTRHAVALFDRVGPTSLAIQQTQGLLEPSFAPDLAAILDLYQFALV
jgi:hypothetical protein